MKQEKSSNKTPGGGYQKALVNIKDALCSLMMGYTTDEWGELPSPCLKFCKNSTQDVPQNEPINNIVKKVNYSIMHVGDTILDAAAEARINKNWCLLDN